MCESMDVFRVLKREVNLFYRFAAVGKKAHFVISLEITAAVVFIQIHVQPIEFVFSTILHIQ